MIRLSESSYPFSKSTASSSFSFPWPPIEIPDGVIYGSNGDDDIYGTGNNDTIAGLGGEDIIYAGAGHDTVYGGNDTDFLFGNLGNDSLFGGDGKDYLYGHEGNDTLFGQAGNDELYGGSGADTFYFDFGKGTDIIHDFQAGDIIRLSGVDYSYSDVWGSYNVPQLVWDPFGGSTSTKLSTKDGRTIILKFVHPDQLKGHVVDGDFIWYI